MVEQGIIALGDYTILPDDRIDYAKDGQEVGLKTYLMDWPYNREGWVGPRVKNWREIYDYATQRS